jgi:hypothetical protein
VTLPAAVAVSAAAVSPLAGRTTRQSQRVLLALANVRLGLWLPNPLLVTTEERSAGSGPLRRLRDQFRPYVPRLLRRLWDQFRQPGPRLLLLELVGRTHLGGKWVYVSDGGHFDNSALVEALRRKPRTIFAFDASGDPVDRWSTLGTAVALARTELGAHVELRPTDMKPTGRQYVTTPFVRGDVWYAPVDLTRPPDATLWVTKLGVRPDAPWDVRAYAERFPEFPSDPTFFQLYGDEQFEAYRMLGRDATDQMLREYRIWSAQRLRTGPATDPAGADGELSREGRST